MRNQYIDNIVLMDKISNQINVLALNNHILIEKQTSIVELQSANLHKVDEINEYLDKYQENILAINQAIYFENFRTEFQDYQNVVQEVFNYLKSNDSQAVTHVLVNKEVAVYEQLQETITEIKKQNQYEFTERYKNLTKSLNKNILVTTLLTIIAIFVLIAISIISFFDINATYSQIKNRLTKLSSGDIPKTEMDISKSELGQLGKPLNQISENIKRIEKFTTYIEQDNYEFDFKQYGENDFIGQSLLKLKQNLIKTRNEQLQRKIEDTRKSWARDGIAKFGEIMRQSSDNIQTLADNIIKNMVVYVDAKVGGLFIYDENNPSDVHLYLLSSFAYDRKKYLSKKVSLGDGLVGAAALDRTSIYLKDIPEGYIEIESGLGDASPKSLFIVPLKTERGTLGVIEIASFRQIEEFEMEFMEELAETIASTLETVKINARTVELLNESEKNSKELANRENELRKTMQQVQFAQEESERRAVEMTSILSAVDQTLLKLELDTDGRIISANQRYLRTFSYLHEEVTEKELVDILPRSHRDEHKKIINELVEGQTHRATYKFETESGKNVWLLSQFAPIMGMHNNLLRILYLAIDITEQKEIEERNSKLLGESVNKADELMRAHTAAKRNELEMQGIMIAIDQTLMKAEYTVEGNLSSANEKHITTMGYDFEQTKGKNIKSFIPKDEELEFNRIWSLVLDGKMQQITVKRKSQSTNKELWLLNQYTPVKDDRGKIFKILYLAIDISEQKEIELRNVNLLQQAKEKEEALLRSQKKMRGNEIEMQGIITAIDQTLMKAEYSAEGLLLTANDMHINTLGYDFEQTKGRNIKSFIPKEEVKQFNEVWTKVSQGEMQQIVVKRKNNAGKTIWLLNQYTPILGEENKIIKILYLANEITEQKETEQKNEKLLKLASNKEKILVKAHRKMILDELEMKGILSAIDQTLMKAEFLPDGSLLSANILHIKILGYDFEKRRGENIQIFIPKEEIEEFNIIWEKVINGEMQQVTLKRKNRKGQDIWLFAQYTPILDKRNNIIKILFLANDISEQKKAELDNKELLSKSLENEKMLLNNQQKMKANEREMNAIISAVDQTLMKAEYSVGGRLLTANANHIEIMGYDFKTTRGSDIITFIPEDEVVEFMKMWDKVKNGDAQQLTVKRRNQETQQDIWLLNQYTPVRNENDRVFKILYIAVDITKQKDIELKNENILKESLENERKLLTNQQKIMANEREMNAIITAVDQTLMKAEYSKGGRLLSANEKHIEIMGYDFETTKGSDIKTFIPKDEVEEFIVMWDKVKVGEAQQLTVKRKNKKTGHNIWLLSQYTPVRNQNNRVFKILYIAIDITKQKEIEEALILQEESMRLNMEELFEQQIEMEEKLSNYESKENEIKEQFDSLVEKRYEEWLKIF